MGAPPWGRLAGRSPLRGPVAAQAVLVGLWSVWGLVWALGLRLGAVRDRVWCGGGVNVHGRRRGTRSGLLQPLGWKAAGLRWWMVSRWAA